MEEDGCFVISAMDKKLMSNLQPIEFTEDVQPVKR